MAKFVANFSLYGIYDDLPTDNDPATEGRYYVAYDTNQFFRDNGSTWDEITLGGAGGISVDAGGTPVDPTTSITFVGASLTDLGSGIAQVTIGGSGASPILFNQTATTSISNGTPASLNSGTFVGPNVVEGGTLQVGSIFKLKYGGQIAASASPQNFEVFIYVDGSTSQVLHTSNTIDAFVTGFWDLEAEIVCRTTGISGTFKATGTLTITNATGVSTTYALDQSGNSMDTTADQDVPQAWWTFIAWGSGSALSAHVGSCELIQPPM